MTMQIGVLAVQGAYSAHLDRLHRLGVTVRLVRHSDELEGLDGLVLPGGESTAMLRLLERQGGLGPLRDFVRRHPTLGTCAGLILLAEKVTPAQAGLGLLDVEVTRNGYGRQLDSRVVTGSLLGDGESQQTAMEMVFIRAPRITATGPQVKTLATREGEPVLVRQGHLLGCAFHPELGQDDRIHRLLLDLVNAQTTA